MEPGTTLMAPGGGSGDVAILEQGRLIAQGTADLPVTFTSATDSGPAEWDGLFIRGSAQLDHVIVRNGKFNVGVFGPENSQVQIANSTTSNSSEYPLWIDPTALHRLQMSNVTFTENARNRILIEPESSNERLVGNATLTAQPGLEGYVIKPWNDPTPQLEIPAGLTLTVAPSVTIMAAENVIINVGGRLEAQGTAVSPVTFTSITDTLPGEWGGLVISGTANLNHAIIRNGQRNLDVLGAAGSVLIANSEVGQASEKGLAVENGQVTAVCTNFGDGHRFAHVVVIPAKAGIHLHLWIPAFAGMTVHFWIKR